MKRRLLIGVMGLLVAGCLAGCGKAEGMAEKVTEPLELSVDAHEEEDMGIQEISQGNITWNADAIYLQSVHSGYLSEYDIPQGQLLMIDGAEDLILAEKKFHLGVGNAQEEGMYTELAQAFQTMKEQYPAQDYVYFMSYQTVTSGGYDWKTDQFTITDGEAKFELSKDSSAPGADEMAIDVMDGFTFLAAVERSKIAEVSVDNVINLSGSTAKKDLKKVFEKPKDESTYVVNSYNGKMYVPNCLLFRLNSDATEEEIEKLLSSNDMVILEKIDATGEYEVTFSVEKTEEELMEMESWIREYGFVDDTSLFYVKEGNVE